MKRPRLVVFLALVALSAGALSTLALGQQSAQPERNTIGDVTADETVEFVSEPVDGGAFYVVASRQGETERDPGSLVVWKLNGTNDVLWERSITRRTNESFGGATVRDDGILLETASRDADRFIRLTRDGEVQGTLRKTEEDTALAFSIVVPRPESGYYLVTRSTTTLLSNSLETQWTRERGDDVERLDTLSDGSLVTANRVTDREGYITHTVLSRVAPDGDLIWQRNFSDSAVDEIHAVGDRFVLETTGLESGDSSFVVLDSEANTVYTGQSRDQYAVAETETGVVARGLCPDRSCRNQIVRIDESGDIAWETSIPTRSNESVDIHSHGTTAVGTSNGTVIVVDDGEVVYDGTFEPINEDPFDDPEVRLELTGQGGVLVQNGTMVVRIDSTGTEQWRREIAGDPEYELVAATASTDGSTTAVFEYGGEVLFETRNRDGRLERSSNASVWRSETVFTEDGTIVVGTDGQSFDDVVTVRYQQPRSGPGPLGTPGALFTGVLSTFAANVDLVLGVLGGVAALTGGLVLAGVVWPYAASLVGAIRDSVPESDEPETGETRDERADATSTGDADSLECPNCGAAFDSSAASMGDRCETCGDGYLTESGDGGMLDDGS